MAISEFDKSIRRQILYFTEKSDIELRKLVLKNPEMVEKLNATDIVEMCKDFNVLEVKEILETPNVMSKLLGSNISYMCKNFSVEDRKLILQVPGVLDKLIDMNIVYMCEGFEPKDRKAILETPGLIEKLKGSIILYMCEGFDSKAQKYVLEMPGVMEKLDGDELTYISKNFGVEDRKAILETPGLIEKLSGSNIAVMYKDFEPQYIKNLLQLPDVMEKIVGDEIVLLCEKFDVQDRKAVLEIEGVVDKLFGDEIIFMCQGLDIQDRKNILETSGVIDKLSGFELAWLCRGFDVNYIKSILLNPDIVKQIDGDIVSGICEALDSKEKDAVIFEVIKVHKEKFNIKEISKMINIKSDQLSQIYSAEEIDKMLEDYVSLIEEVDRDKCISLFRENKVGIKTIKQISTEAELIFCNIFGELYDTNDTISINTIGKENLVKLNKKHINTIKKYLQVKGVAEGNLSVTALNMYCTMGFNRAIEILQDKYGEITPEQIITIFKEVDLSDVTFDKKRSPEINTEMVNMTLGQNHKVSFKASPLKRYLANYNEKETDLFFERFGFVFSNWDRIKEEVARKKANSNLEVRRNIGSVTEVLKIIEREEIIPECEADWKLLVDTDILDYAGKDNQYTINPEGAISRAIELSRKQEICKTKKFPQVDMSIGKLTLTTYHPQDRRILCGGYKTGCCFKPNALADDFGNSKKSLLEYCVTSEYGGGIEIRSDDGEVVMFSPILRNGNMLMIHSYETKNKSARMVGKVNEVLEKYAEEVLKKSKEVEGEEGIQAVLITDFNENLFDTRRKKGIFLKKFTVHGEESQEVYTTLKYSNHYILGISPNITQKDFHTGDVEKSYEFFEKEKKAMISFTEEDIEFIKEYEKNTREIARLTNKRKELLSEGKYDLATEVLREIKEIKNKRSQLNEKHVVGIKKLDEIKRQRTRMQAIVDKVSVENGKTISSIKNDVYKRVISGEEYFLYISESGSLIYESTEEGKEKVEELKKKWLDFRGGNKVKCIRYSDLHSNIKNNQEEKEEKYRKRSTYIGGGAYEK